MSPLAIASVASRATSSFGWPMLSLLSAGRCLEDAIAGRGLGQKEPSASVPRESGARLTCQRALDVLWIRDDGLAAALLQVPHDGLDLRSHAAAGEVPALGQVLLGLSEGQVIDPLLVRLGVVQGHSLHGGADHEQDRKSVV